MTITRHGSGSPADCPPLEQAVVRFVQELTFEHLDDAAHAGVGRLLRDQLALQIGISQLPWSRQLLSFASAQARPGRSRVAPARSRGRGCRLRQRSVWAWVRGDSTARATATPAVV
jgi:hypothetical protein